MKLVKTEEAVGHVLCHDMTQIIPGVMKDAGFRKGHIVTKADIPVLLSMGKRAPLCVGKTTRDAARGRGGGDFVCHLPRGEHLPEGAAQRGKDRIDRRL